MINTPLALYTAAQTRELDRLAIEQHGIAGYELMQRAAQASLDALRRAWPRARRLTIVCGPGNNGGDGFVLGRLARRAGLDVRMLALADKAHGDAGTARDDYLADGGELVQARAGGDLPAADVYVDALFGSGLNRAVEGLAAELIDRLNAMDAPVLALDIPSGLDADSGSILGRCVHAAATVCFVGWKQGLFTHRGTDCCGKLSLETLDVPSAVYAQVTAGARLMQPMSLPPRQRDSHKGRYGHVLVLGGDHGYGGAVRLAGEASLRCGAGLVSVASRQAHVAPLLAARPELMVHVAADQGVAPELLRKATVLVLGPGLGLADWGRQLFAQAMDSDLPLLLDADGLNLLAAAPGSFSGRPVVLTPHPGEAARLLGCESGQIQNDRFAAVRELAQKFACVVVLKGAGSLVSDAGGEVAVCPWGNPGMASGGMGDVLSGVIGALLAQGLEPRQAAELGTALHSRAADRAAADGQRGMLASDLLPLLRQLLESDRD